MTRLPSALAAACLLALAACGSTGEPVADTAPANVLTAADEAEGWTLLFNGETTRGWRGFRREDVPEGWVVEDGTLHRAGSGGDIMTEDQFDDFELRLQWKISKGGNSGIFFHVNEERGNAVYETGPEMQVLDDEEHPDGRSPLTSAGSNYGLHPPIQDVVRPVGQWNDVRIVVDGDRVEHWLNDEKIVEYRLGSPEWLALVNGSKFKQWPGYGRAGRGHIALQDHGDPVWYRNIAIKRL